MSVHATSFNGFVDLPQSHYFIRRHQPISKLNRRKSDSAAVSWQIIFDNLRRFYGCRVLFRFSFLLCFCCHFSDSYLTYLSHNRYPSVDVDIINRYNPFYACFAIIFTIIYIINVCIFGDFALFSLLLLLFCVFFCRFDCCFAHISTVVDSRSS